MNIMHFVVAYPHPSVPDQGRLRQVVVGSQFSSDALLERLSALYPEHSPDLKGATFWKASRSSVAPFPA